MNPNEKVWRYDVICFDGDYIGAGWLLFRGEDR